MLLTTKFGGTFTSTPLDALARHRVPLPPSKHARKTGFGNEMFSGRDCNFLQQLGRQSQNLPRFAEPQWECDGIFLPYTRARRHRLHTTTSKPFRLDQGKY